jgi:hypothetical protein
VDLKDAIQRPIGRCPLCRCDLERHSYWDNASAAIDSEKERNLQKLIESRRWAEANAYHHANFLGDLRVWRAVLCPRSRIAIFPVLLALELWINDSADAPVLLNELESRRLKQFVGDRWKPL